MLNQRSIKQYNISILDRSNTPKKLRKGRVKLFSPDSCSQESSFQNKRYGNLNFCFKFKMAAKNQNGGKNVTRVNISAVISPIMIIFSAFIIFPRPRSLILILYLILEFNMAAKIQDGCHKVIQFYKVAIKLSVHEFFQ